MTTEGLPTPEVVFPGRTEEFYDHLHDGLDTSNPNDYNIIIAGDLISRIGNISEQSIMGWRGERNVNQNEKIN